MSAAGTPAFGARARRLPLEPEMMLAGERVNAGAVGQITDRLDDSEPLAIKLHRAVEHEHAMVPLTSDDRVRLLEVLDGPPLGLGALRSRLLVQVGRHRT